MDAPKPKMLTPAQAAAQHDISEDTIIRMIKTGRLAAVNRGAGRKKKRYRIAQKDLDAIDQTAGDASSDSRNSR